MPAYVPSRARYGRLNTYVVDGGAKPNALAIFSHGYGAPGHDLVGLATEIFDALGEESGYWRFVFPEAPMSLAELGMPTGRAWWEINMQQLVMLSAAGRWDLVRAEEPPGIRDAGQMLAEAVGEIVAELRGPKSEASVPLVLGGFSQGAMLSMETALRGLASSPQGLILFSGTLVCEKQWRELAPDRLRGLPVFQSHGRQDPILPYQAAEWLATYYSRLART